MIFYWGQRYIDELIARFDLRSSAFIYSLPDANWNVVAIADTSANILERYAYTAYGVVQFLDEDFNPLSGNVSAYGWETLFCGYRYDSATGLYLVRDRSLNPAVGTWLTFDPLSYRKDSDRFRYVVNNPINATDPSGLLQLVTDAGWADNTTGCGPRSLCEKPAWKSNLGLHMVNAGHEIPFLTFGFPGVGKIKAVVWLQRVEVSREWSLCKSPLGIRRSKSYHYWEWFSPISFGRQLGEGQLPSVHAPIRLFGLLLADYRFFGIDFHETRSKSCFCYVSMTHRISSYAGITYGAASDKFFGVLATDNTAPPNVMPDVPRQGSAIALGTALEWGFTVKCILGRCVRTEIYGVS